MTVGVTTVGFPISVVVMAAAAVVLLTAVVPLMLNVPV
jgi:hypothetical protein